MPKCDGLTIWLISYSLLLAIVWWLPLIMSFVFFRITGDSHFGSYYFCATSAITISIAGQIYLFIMRDKAVSYRMKDLAIIFFITLAILPLAIWKQKQKVDRLADHILLIEAERQTAIAQTYIMLNRPKGGLNDSLFHQTLPYWVFIAESDLRTLNDWLAQNYYQNKISPLRQDAGLSLKISLTYHTHTGEDS